MNGIQLCVLTLVVAVTVLAASGSEAELQLTAVELGRIGIDGSDLLTHDGDTVELIGRGSTRFNHEDTGSGFAFVETDAKAFTFVARVAGAPRNAPDAKYGIALRTGTGSFDRMIALRQVMVDGEGRLEWLMRHGPAKSTHDGSQRLFRNGSLPKAKLREGFWLKLVRRYPTVELFYSTDGDTWQAVAPDYHLALLEQEVKVGLMLAAGGDGNAPATTRFEHVSFTTNEPPSDGLTRQSFVEYRYTKQPWEMFLIQADTERYGPDSQTFFVLKPKSLAWKDVRAAIYTTGDKEVMLDDNSRLEFESGPNKRRRPRGMAEWEGVYELDNLRPWYQILAHYGVVRLASPGRSEPAEQALSELSEKFGAPQIANLPLLATGASASGGQAAHTANLMPERMVGSAPVLIGAAGVDLENSDALLSPRLYIYGSRDTGGAHHKKLIALDSVFRENRALWGAAPIWWGHHRWWYTDRLMTPYFLTLIDLRVPADADLTAGPVALKTLAEESGYLGLNDTWGSRFPQVVAWKEATEQQRRSDTSWLPDALIARVWQSFVSDWPRTIIHFPRSDGAGGFGGGRHHPGREDHFLPADEPWNLVASGPIGGDVRVDYYAGLRKLRVLRTYNDNPYLVQLEGLPPGLHVIHTVTTVGEFQEISHPSTVMFQRRER